MKQGQINGREICREAEDVKARKKLSICRKKGKDEGRGEDSGMKAVGRKQ